MTSGYSIFSQNKALCAPYLKLYIFTKKHHFNYPRTNNGNTNITSHNPKSLTQDQWHLGSWPCSHPS